MSQPQSAQFVLPEQVVTRADFLHLINQLEQLDADLTTASVQARVGAKTTQPPTVSPLVEAFVSTNQLDIRDSTARTQLITRLRSLKDTLPVVHMTFATRADQHSLQTLVAWLRQSIHPMSVVTVGLQPELISGVYIRTANRVYDLSVRQKLSEGRHLLNEAVEAIGAGR